MTETQKAYTAGFFDGEGCVILRLNPRRGGVVETWIEFAQSNKAILDQIREWIGDGRWAKSKQPGYDRTCWKLQLSGKAYVPILELLLPYLIVKKRQAELALAFQSCPWRKEPNSGHVKRNDWQKRIDAWFTRESKRLKQVA